MLRRVHHKSDASWGPSHDNTSGLKSCSLAQKCDESGDIEHHAPSVTTLPKLVVDLGFKL